jgi:hypothetical protein
MTCPTCAQWKALAESERMASEAVCDLVLVLLAHLDLQEAALTEIRRGMEMIVRTRDERRAISRVQ